MMTKMRKVVQFIMVAVLFLLVVGAAEARSLKLITVVETTRDYFTEAGAVVIDFEDAGVFPGMQYVDSHGVKFSGRNSQIVKLTTNNREGDPTVSGEYSIMNDAIYPGTSANIPLVISFDDGVGAVGFYMGNGVGYGQVVRAKIAVFGAQGELLRSFEARDIPNSVKRFLGVKSTVPIYRVEIDYGAVLLSEDVDDVMFVRFAGGVGNDEEECQIAGLCLPGGAGAENGNIGASSNVGNISRVSDVLSRLIIRTNDSSGSQGAGRSVGVVGAVGTGVSEAVKCTDSDATEVYQYLVPGVVYGRLNEWGPAEKREDFCSSETEVVEFGCDGSLAKKKGEYDCRVEGKVCRGGACVYAGGSGIVKGVAGDQTISGVVAVRDEASDEGMLVSGEGANSLRYVLPFEDEGKRSAGAVDMAREADIVAGVCESGCRVDGKCLPLGTRLSSEGQSRYCALNSNLEGQQGMGAACQSNFECKSNTCQNSKCVNTKEELRDMRVLVEKIMGWLAGIAG